MRLTVNLGCEYCLFPSGHAPDCPTIRWPGRLTDEELRELMNDALGG